MKQKERVLWPLYEYKEKPSLGAIKEQKQSGMNKEEEEQESEAKLAKRMGKNPKLFNHLQSVQAIKKLDPLVNGRQNQIYIPDVDVAS